ncbi:MAG: hypothetical protein AAF226_06635 [Verrucomicrobiota bacterium]
MLKTSIAFFVYRSYFRGVTPPLMTDPSTRKFYLIQGIEENEVTAADNAVATPTIGVHAEATAKNLIEDALCYRNPIIFFASGRQIEFAACHPGLAAEFWAQNGMGLPQ